MKQFFLAIFLSLELSLISFPDCASELKPVVERIYALPEGKEVMERVEAEDPIKITCAPLNCGSCAMWCGDIRTIILNSNSHLSFGQKLRATLFELHNASSTKAFMQIDEQAMNRQISREAYTRIIEKMEHQNALETCRLIVKGRAQEIFPKDTDWPILKDFESHFALQQSSGHSDYIAQIYDELGKSDSRNS